MQDVKLRDENLTSANLGSVMTDTWKRLTQCMGNEGASPTRFLFSKRSKKITTINPPKNE